MFPISDDEVAKTYGYHPLVDDVTELVDRGTFRDVLVIGDEDLPDLTGKVASYRMTTEVEVEFPRGLYWFSDPGDSRLMIVTVGADPSAPATVRPGELSDDHAMMRALGWFEEFWAHAQVIPNPRFSIGQDVIVLPHGQDATVRRRSLIMGQWMYGIRVDGRMRDVAERSLDDQPDNDDPMAWVGQPPTPAARFVPTLTRAKLRGAFTDTVFSFRATRTTFRPYQFRPVIKLLQTGKLRLLVADEVGLGKTIEAGLLWTELEARRLANRVLVVCPSSLVAKWQREMDDRFGFFLEELDADGLQDLLDRLRTDRVPPRAAYVCTLERLRRWDGLESMAMLRPNFDLVIVDEAHTLRNTGTRSNALGQTLSEWTDALVFLSATPLNLRNRDLFNLLEILTPGEFEDMESLEQRLEPNAPLHRIAASLFDSSVTNSTRLTWLRELKDMAFGRVLIYRPEFKMLEEILQSAALTPSDIVEVRRLLGELHALSATVTRTRKVEVQEDKALREPHPINVELTDAEARFYSEFYEWCRRRAAKSATPVGFSMQMPLRIVSTCIPVARQHVLEWVGSDNISIDEDDPEASTNTRAIAGLAPHNELLKLAHEIEGVDSKFTEFKPAVRDFVAQGKQLLVFTFSRETLSYLEQGLRHIVRVAVLHGDVGKQQRLQVMADFRAGQYDLVLATRVASEGLDFEFCSVVINYDLPWNPMEVEQRIGRIDRIGQQEQLIKVVSFHTPGTIESDIVGRFMERIDVFKQSIGELEPILNDHLTDIRELLFDFELTDKQRKIREDQLLATIEQQASTAAELESASPYLLSTDSAEIDGLESDLLNSGRYVGQPELALLLQDWAKTIGGEAKLGKGDRYISVRGNAAMADQMHALATAGDRSRREVADLASDLANELTISLSLDQEWSREGGPDLLTANHPAVLAALSVPGHRQSRYACVSLENPNRQLRPGQYLVQLAIAHWQGLRPTSEIWTAVVDLEASSDGPPEIGDALLAQVASAQLHDRTSLPALELGPALQRAHRQMLGRQHREEDRRRRENAALLETRRISVSEIHRRKLDQIRTRMESVRQGGNETVLRLFEAQLEHAEQRHRQVIAEINRSEECGMSVEPLAVCVVEVAS